ncbi:MAG: hypothetical protein F4X35_00900, partial [Alphaproteobacteria bacterium]|nr:hypothetical protein [Alphaproteobacteria bacterium]
FYTASNAPIDVDEGIDWIQQKLTVPTGMMAGQRFRLEPWQERWVRDSYRDHIRSAGLSVARKNGKSGMIAALLLCHLTGPWNRPQWRAVVTSLTGNLAKELRMAIEQTAGASGLRVITKLSPTPGIVKGAKGAQVDFIAADKGSGHAVGADVAIIDEMGLLPEAKRPLVNAMYTSISSRNGKFLGISIQGDGPLFREMESRAGDPAVHWKRWAAESGCDILDENGWAAANPGLGKIKSTAYMRDAAQRALANSSDQSYFRAYDLNQNLDPTREMICGVDDWLKLYEEDALLAGEPVVVGVDLGGSVSMSAVVAIGIETGTVRCWTAFGDTPSLFERGRADAVDNRYVMMQQRGELSVYPGRLVPVPQFLHDVFQDLAATNCRVLRLGADRYRKAELLTALDEAAIRVPLELRGQGASATADGSADVRAFQRLVLNRGLRMAPSLVMESAISNSTLRRDGAGNPALDRSHDRGRIDVLSAAVIAAGLYSRRPTGMVQYALI